MDYRATKDLTLQYYYGNLQDFYKQHFLGLKYDCQVGPGTLRTDPRHFDNRSDGTKGHDPDYHTFGYHGDSVTKGKVDSRLSNAQFTCLVNGHTFTAGLPTPHFAPTCPRNGIAMSIASEEVLTAGSYCMMPGFHEVRALSLHLYKKAGKDGQKIAGHASEGMTKTTSETTRKSSGPRRFQT
ncbi:putative family S43 non-peptidase protein [Pseudomonas mucidolens]|nr:putative family S43 non-peptidase protein [Pseudomonas mucidolens]